MDRYEAVGYAMIFVGAGMVVAAFVGETVGWWQDRNGRLLFLEFLLAGVLTILLVHAAGAYAEQRPPRDA